MRIVYIITRAETLSGAQIHVRDLSRALLERHHDITVLVGGEGPFTRSLEFYGIPYRSLSQLRRSLHPVYDISAFFAIRKALKELRPDLIATHSSKAGFLGRLAGASTRIPTLFTAHGWSYLHESMPLFQRAVYKLMEMLAVPLSARIVTVSDDGRSFAQRRLHVPPAKVITIHNGVPDIPQSLYSDPSACPPRLVMVARLEPPEKDHGTLLKVLARLSDLEWQLDLVGDGPLRHALEKMVSRLNLDGKVRFWGTRTDVAEILSQVQLFVLISKTEGFPISILEAMRAGLPIIASHVGGIPESVHDSINGFLVPLNQPDVLYDRLQLLLTDHELRKQMGAASRRLYAQHFTFDQMLEKTAKLYSQLIHRAEKMSQ